MCKKAEQKYCKKMYCINYNQFTAFDYRITSFIERKYAVENKKQNRKPMHHRQ